MKDQNKEFRKSVSRFKLKDSSPEDIMALRFVLDPVYRKRAYKFTYPIDTLCKWMKY